jgi:uncharacterized RDD family membrane protein YckC
MKSLKFLTAVVALMMILSAAALARDLLAAGSADMYWIARVDKNSDGQIQTQVQSRHIGSDGSWQQIAVIGSRVESITKSGTNLAALLESGDWMMLWDGGSSTGALPEDGAKLLMLAGGKDSLWAIAAAQSGRAPTTRAATQPAATMPAGMLLLYRLEKGEWKMIAPLPPSVKAASELSLGIFDEAPTLAALMDRGEVREFVFNGKIWEAAPPMHVDRAATRIKFLDDLQHDALWAAGANDAGTIYFRDAQPVKLAALVKAEDLTVAGQSIRVLSVADGNIVEYAFAPDGTPRGKTTLPAPAAIEEEKPFEWLSAVAAGMLVLVLVNSMRRRDAAPPEALEAAKLELAPIGLRLLAGTIDAIPVIGTVILFSIYFEPANPSDISGFVQAMQIPLYISTAIYVLHTLLSEWLWGTTIGKRICGLRVTMVDGAKPSVRAVVLRNILRVVDVAMFFPLLLVLISPLRQRVGDFAGETVVVRDRKSSE